MHLTKTTTRAFAASLVMVAAGGTVAGAAVFHLPILGLGGTSVASANGGSQTAKPVAAAPKKVRPKVIVKTRYADVVVHVPASAGVSGSSGSAAAPMQPTTPSAAQSSADETNEPAEASEPEATTTVPTTAAEHDDESEFETEHDEDGPEVHEHEGAEPEDDEHADSASDDSVVQP